MNSYLHIQSSAATASKVRQHPERKNMSVGDCSFNAAAGEPQRVALGSYKGGVML